MNSPLKVGHVYDFTGDFLLVVKVTDETLTAFVLKASTWLYADLKLMHIPLEDLEVRCMRCRRIM